MRTSACAMDDGSLVVTRNRAKGGIRLVGETTASWIDSIEHAIDSEEASMLCRALAGQQQTRIWGQRNY